MVLVFYFFQPTDSPRKQIPHIPLNRLPLLPSEPLVTQHFLSISLKVRSSEGGFGCLLDRLRDENCGIVHGMPAVFTLGVGYGRGEVAVDIDLSVGGCHLCNSRSDVFCS